LQAEGDGEVVQGGVRIQYGDDHAPTPRNCVAMGMVRAVDAASGTLHILCAASREVSERSEGEAEEWEAESARDEFVA
jgi:hypothetical protein